MTDRYANMINDGCPERIWIESDGGCPYFYPEEELSDVSPPITEYVRADKLEELAAEIEALRAEVAALKSENEMLREALKDADNEMDRLDEDMDTCDHSVGVCTCSYWSMRQKMKAARGMGGLSDD